eukprot:CAMPEP_0201514398 /NCGR_PEP_ID=MMETSP0161_2-20130828/6250_1 /ASSEMBLY_ACC=CAM_ASM_000251 /TAXON_ID=180227 /ORGANISM="Neoparamoeba aestuarina, Strain SoJaBio B1-5/56/2" /LENGTH=192 /DNA_ID=CAMNT_0047910935 /DNA_START=95 /DNA_END=670 /DNA_ORIENTATION=+
MRLFFEGISHEGMQDIGNLDEGDFCGGWAGIRCEDETIREIRYSNLRAGNFNISALPHSTAIVWITSCAQTFVIDTRSFPRQLEQISLGLNRITGHLDLTTLPVGLINAYLWGNAMTGPLVLTHLPRGLVKLFVDQNDIRQGTVWYDNLPDSIERICLQNNWDKTLIREVRAVNPENAVADKDIFGGIKEEN